MSSLMIIMIVVLLMGMVVVSQRVSDTPDTIEPFDVNEQEQLDETQDKQPSCRTDADCNIVYGDGENVCKSDGSCHCVTGVGLFCHEGTTNYKDPRDMSREELDTFKEAYRSDYTVQDYRNWLLLYKDDPRNLREHHRTILRKLLRGGQITYKDLPRVLHVPPVEPHDYFKKMYNNGKISIQFPEAKSETGAFLGHNYGNYTDFIPPENLEKTWITGTVDLYRQKVEPHELNYYIRPDVTSGDERSAVGNKFIQDRLKRMLEETPPDANPREARMEWDNRKTEQLEKIDRQENNNTGFQFIS